MEISEQRRKRIDVVTAAPMNGGRTKLLKHLNGERLQSREAIIAKCCDCMCYHVDGRLDCRIPMCPLYPFMPYKGGK